MSEPTPDPAGGAGGQPRDPSAFTQEIQHSAVSARVPEKVARGVFSTGALVLQGPHEFVVDFLVGLAHPPQIVARVVLPVSILPSVIAALRDNLGKYTSRYGPPPTLPQQTPAAKPPSAVEIYEQFKLPDELLSGAYANGLMINHSASEFILDFISNFYPRSAVSCRVFLSAPQVPGLLATLSGSFQQYQQKRSAAPPDVPPAS